LTEIAGLAADAGDSETVRRLRLTAGRALDLFDVRANATSALKATATMRAPTVSHL
jgi:hypothetical protein